MNEKEMKEKYSKELHLKCVRPFCLNQCEIPNDLKLCIRCFKELEELVGLRAIYDFSGKTPKVKMSIKEAIETLLMDAEDAILTLRDKKSSGSNSRKKW
jgi:hypothetical protein